MKKYLQKTGVLLLIFIFQGCGIYNFTGADIGEAKTFQVNFFQNLADQNPGSIFEPGLDRNFTLALQDVIRDLTSLNLVNTGGDLLYEGEITEYRVQPNTATSNQTAAQNRLNMRVNVRFFNRTKPDLDFERSFSFFFDFSANDNLSNVQTEAEDILFERLTQDIFNASLSNW